MPKGVHEASMAAFQRTSISSINAAPVSNECAVYNTGESTEVGMGVSDEGCD